MSQQSEIDALLSAGEGEDEVEQGDPDEENTEEVEVDAGTLDPEDPEDGEETEGEEDPAEAMRREMKAMRDEIAALKAGAGTQEVVEEEFVPVARVEDLPLDELFTEEEIEEGVFSTKAGLVSLTKRVLALAQKMYLQDGPEMIGKSLQRQQAYRATEQTFWEANGDLKEHLDLLKDLTLVVQAGNPNMAPAAVLAEAASRARKHLGIAKKADSRELARRRNPGFAPVGGSGGVRQQRTDKRTKLQQDIDEILNARP